MKERRDIALLQLPNCRTYRRHEDLMRDPDVELIDIATRSDDHASHVIQGLKSGKWVNIERPFCCDGDEAMVIRAAAIRSGNKLLIRQNYRFEESFLQTKEVIASKVLGEVYDIKIQRGFYHRRDDWQTVKRCGGGIAFAMGGAFLDQALEFLKSPPVKIYSDFKRIASVGDAEDYMRIVLRNISNLTVDLEVSGGRIGRDPLFKVSGTKGEFRIYPGEKEGILKILDPKKKLARRRSSVRTPPLGSYGTPEELSWIEKKIPIKPKAESGMTLIWEHVFNTIRENKPYPVQLDGAIETIKILSMVKKESAFA